MLQTIQKHRFLLEELVKRDFDRKYKGALLGAAWSVMNPLLTLLIMSVVFGHFFGGAIEHYTTYLFCGTVVFSFFTESTAEGLMALVNNAHIFTKVNVPKYLFVLAKNAQTLINFFLTLLVFLLFCALDGITFSWRFLLLLYPVGMLLLFNLGMGFILSALYVFYRDIQYLWGVLTQFLLYLSAVFYDVTSLPAAYQRLFLLNPVYAFIKYFRLVVIDKQLPSFSFHMLLMLYTLIALVIGGIVYKKNNRKFAFHL